MSAPRFVDFSRLHQAVRPRLRLRLWAKLHKAKLVSKENRHVRSTDLLKRTHTMSSRNLMLHESSRSSERICFWRCWSPRATSIRHVRDVAVLREPSAAQRHQDRCKQTSWQWVGQANTKISLILSNNRSVKPILLTYSHFWYKNSTSAWDFTLTQPAIANTTSSIAEMIFCILFEPKSSILSWSAI